MKKILATMALAATALAAAAPAMAGAMYAGADVGYSRMGGLGLTDKSGALGSVYLGYQADKTLGAELGYTRLGDVKAGSATVHPEMMTLQGVVTKEVMHNVNVFAKGGAAFVHTRGDARSSKWAPVVGVGAEYEFSKNVSGVAQLQYVHKPVSVGGNFVNTSVGMKYKF